MTNKATEQAVRVSPISGVAPPREHQFGQPNGNPPHNGSWKKEDTARYKLEQMMKLSESELEMIINNQEAPLFECKLAKAIKDGDWKVIEGMMNQVYGQPKQAVDFNDITPPQPLSPRKVKKEEK